MHTDLKKNEKFRISQNQGFEIHANYTLLTRVGVWPIYVVISDCKSNYTGITRFPITRQIHGYYTLACLGLFEKNAFQKNATKVNPHSLVCLRRFAFPMLAMCLDATSRLNAKSCHPAAMSRTHSTCNFVMLILQRLSPIMYVWHRACLCSTQHKFVYDFVHVVPHAIQTLKAHRCLVHTFCLNTLKMNCVFLMQPWRTCICVRHAWHSGRCAPIDHDRRQSIALQPAPIRKCKSELVELKH